MAIAKRRTKQKPEFTGYTFDIVSWSVGYAARPGEDERRREYFNLALGLRLLEPVKGVSEGSVTLYGDTERTGGYLHYDSEKAIRGALWIGLEGASCLRLLLSAGHQVRLDLWGKPFYYRNASIRDVCWYMVSHPELDETLYDEDQPN